MNILALDTSTAQASVAIVNDEKLLAESIFHADRCLSARLVPEIERLLAVCGLTIDDIDLFAAANGPGSFTGIRAGVATVQGLALATGKPCAGFSTLTMLAMNFPLASLPVCAMLDARKSEVYAGLYDCSAAAPSAIIADSVLPPDKLFERLAEKCTSAIIFAGEGARRYAGMIIGCLGDRAVFPHLPHHAGHAANGAMLARESFRNGSFLSPAELLPVYIRPSEAELARSKA